MKYSLLTLFLAILSSVAWGQARQPRPTVTGKVVENLGGLPIGWATVWSYEDGKQKPLNVAYVKSDGSFAWQTPRAGKYKLVFRAEGFTSDSLVVDLAADTGIGVIRLDNDLKTRTLGIDSVVVTAKRSILTRLFDRYVYDVSQDPDAKRMKMTEIMEKIPGLNSNTPNGMLEYGGVALGEILIDGERHEMINSSLQFPMRLIRGDVMDKIEVIPPGSPQYNNQNTILNIITSRPLPNGVAVEMKGDAATDNAYGGGLDLVSKIRDRVVLRFGYGITYSSRPKLHSYSLREMFADDGSAVSSIGSATESWNDSRMHNFKLRGSAKLLGGKFDFGFSTPLGESDSHTNLQQTVYDASGQVTSAQTVSTSSTSKTMPVLNGDIKYTFKKSPNRTTYIVYQYGESRSETARLQAVYDASSAAQPAEPLSQNDQRTRTHTVQLLNKINMGKVPRNTYGPLPHTLTMWATYTNRDYDYQTEYYGQNPRTGGINYRQHAANFLPSYSYMGKKLNISVSAALDYENDKGRFRGTQSLLDYSQLAFNPSGRLIYNISRKYSLGANYSERSVRPSVDRLDPYVDDTDPMNLYSGNPELKPERLRRAYLSINRQIKGKAISTGSIDLSFSYQAITNAIERVTRVGNDGISLTTYQNIGRSERYGIGLNHMIYLVPKRIGLVIFADYGVLVYHSPDPNVDGNRVAGAGCTATLSGRLWKGGDTRFRYLLSSNMDTSQADKVYYNHSFSLEHSQVLVKNKLFCSVAISNPFESRRTVRNEIAGTNFRTASSYERLGRVFGFTLRCNFGRLKDRVAEAEKIVDDTSRD